MSFPLGPRCSFEPPRRSFFFREYREVVAKTQLEREKEQTVVTAGSKMLGTSTHSHLGRDQSMEARLSFTEVATKTCVGLLHVTFGAWVLESGFGM